MNLYRPLRWGTYIPCVRRMMHDRRLPSVMGGSVRIVKSPKEDKVEPTRTVSKPVQILKEVKNHPKTPHVISNTNLIYMALNDRED